MVAADGFRVIRPEPRLSTKCRTSTAKKNCTKRNNRELFSGADRRQEIQKVVHNKRLGEIIVEAGLEGVATIVVA